MAAVIVVEDGSVVEGANCYFSIAELRAYYEAHAYSAAVDAIADDDDLIPAAIQACREVDASADPRGVPVEWDQDMLWPRLGVRIPVDPAAAAAVGAIVITATENLYATGAGSIPGNVVPKAWKRACMEMVRFILSQDRAQVFDTPARKREKVEGAVEVEYTDRGKAIDLIPEIVQRMIRPFCIGQDDAGAGPGSSGGASAVRLVRG